MAYTFCSCDNFIFDPIILGGSGLHTGNTNIFHYHICQDTLEVK